MAEPANSLTKSGDSMQAGENPPPPTGEKPTAEGSGGNGLVRVTVNLTKRSHRDLQKLTEETGLGKTDVLNRAVQVYALVEDLLSDGEGQLVVTRKDGTQQRIFIL
ncbi:hypothetical protein AB0M02_42995 [Actinoplanes sp. NPDC051861]|uniref:hypothetical protein n=1 Tax=Actinoplanes sp. NPDC051861 TaxID=3155170 RepID=UPI0034288DC3